MSETIYEFPTEESGVSGSFTVSGPISDYTDYLTYYSSNDRDVQPHLAANEETSGTYTIVLADLPEVTSEDYSHTPYYAEGYTLDESELVYQAQYYSYQGGVFDFSQFDVENSPVYLDGGTYEGTWSVIKLDDDEKPFENEIHAARSTSQNLRFSIRIKNTWSNDSGDIQYTYTSTSYHTSQSIAATVYALADSSDSVSYIDELGEEPIVENASEDKFVTRVSQPLATYNIKDVNADEVSSRLLEGDRVNGDHIYVRNGLALSSLAKFTTNLEEKISDNETVHREIGVKFDKTGVPVPQPPIEMLVEWTSFNTYDAEAPELEGFNFIHSDRGGILEGSFTLEADNESAIVNLYGNAELVYEDSNLFGSFNANEYKLFNEDGDEVDTLNSLDNGEIATPIPPGNYTIKLAGFLYEDPSGEPYDINFLLY